MQAAVRGGSGGEREGVLRRQEEHLVDRHKDPYVGVARLGVSDARVDAGGASPLEQGEPLLLRLRLRLARHTCGADEIEAIPDLGFKEEVEDGRPLGEREKGEKRKTGDAQA